MNKIIFIFLLFLLNPIRNAFSQSEKQSQNLNSIIDKLKVFAKVDDDNKSDETKNDKSNETKDDKGAK